MAVHRWFSIARRERLMAVTRQSAASDASQPDALGWRALPPAAQLYVGSVVAVGAFAAVEFFPLAYPRPFLFASLVATSCLTSAWKVTLPLSLSSGSTLSVSYAADLMALLLLGSRPAMLIAVAGAWTQCTFKVRRPYPAYRTVFSMASEAITMVATGFAFAWFGGELGPHNWNALPKPLVGAIATYFCVNTGLVAGAIAVSTRQPLWRVWHTHFLWSAPSFMVAGGAGAVAAVIVEHGSYGETILMLAPVYLTYRTYQVFLGRLEDQRRHLEETRRLHEEIVEALLQARRAEQTLADEKERLAVTLRSIADGVVATDLNGTIVLINDAATALTGWTNDDAVGKPLGAVFQSVDPDTRERCDNSVALLAQDAARLRSSAVLIARDLTERPIEQSAAPLRDSLGLSIGMVLAFRDITDTLRIQEERAKASRLASLGLLAGGIAHDFNNILMAIMGNVSMARATMAQTGAAANALAEAEHACVRARQLTWQLLTFSKGGVPVKKTVGLARILKESASLALRGSNVSCTFDIAPDVWSVPADEGQLIQVFNNVLINAQQAMPRDGVIDVRAENVFEPGGRWEHALRIEPGQYVRVSIIDKGVGIPKEHLGRIFDPYFSTKQQGSGLGLATAYSIVKNHGGYLSVDSTLGQGTTIQVSFPASMTPEIIEPEEPAAPVRRGTRRVLVMDDEASIRRLAVNMLEFLGYDTEVVDNGTAVVERFKSALRKQEPFDVVMLDLIVPGSMGGKEAIDLLVHIDPTVKAILVTGYAQDPAVGEYREHGFKAVINKPFTLQELSRTLRSVIATPTWDVH